MKRKRLGEILLDEGLITEEQLQAGLDKHKREKGLRIGAALVALGAVTAEDVAKAIWQQRQIPYVDLDSYDLDPNVIELVPEKVARAIWPCLFSKLAMLSPWRWRIHSI